jgi:RNA polymerase sigma factor (sigma-70 family)
VSAEAEFAGNRGLIFSVAYRILGSAADAEDVVQEAWLRWSTVDRSQVERPRSYLARVAANLATDSLRTARARRETYLGPWLPEPILTEHDPAIDAAAADSVSIAMLVVLETLSPLERAVFCSRRSSSSPTPRSPGRWSVPRPRSDRPRTGPAGTSRRGVRGFAPTRPAPGRRPNGSWPRSAAGTSTP